MSPSHSKRKSSVLLLFVLSLTLLWSEVLCRSEITRTSVAKTSVDLGDNGPVSFYPGSTPRDGITNTRFPPRRNNNNNSNNNNNPTTTAAAGRPEVVGGQGGYNPGYNNDNNNNNVNPGAESAVAFSVSRASYYTRSALTDIKFDRKITDVGYGWNHGAGEFQCYHPGTYLFTWSAVSAENDKFRVTLMKNSREEVAQSWGHYAGYQSASNSVVLTLRQLDRISLRITEGAIYEPNSSDRGYTTFTGYRLF